MALYYLRESGETSPPSSRKPVRKAFPWTFIGLTLIFLSAVFAALGWSFPSPALMGTLGITPSSGARRGILHLVSGAREGNIPPMDLALAVRGLLKLGPSQVIVDGKTMPDAETAPLLAGILAEGRARFPIIMPPEEASPAYRPIPLVFYDPPGCNKRNWPTLGAAFSNAGHGCFFPAPMHDPAMLPFFADLGGGLFAGSLWWDLLVGDLPSGDRSPVWILGSRFLLIGNRIPLPLTPEGAVDSSASMIPNAGKAPPLSEPVPLEDFLLVLERADRGVPDPVFHSIWKDAVVLIGPAEDSPRLASLRSLRDALSWKRLPLLVQGLFAMLCMGILAHGRRRSGLRIRGMVSLVLVALSGAGLLLLPRYGYLPGLLPPILTAVFLLMPTASPTEKPLVR